MPFYRHNNTAERRELDPLGVGQRQSTTLEEAAFPSTFKKTGGGRIFQEPAASPSEIELLQDTVADTRGAAHFMALQEKRLHFD